MMCVRKRVRGCRKVNDEAPSVLRHLVNAHHGQHGAHDIDHCTGTGCVVRQGSSGSHELQHARQQELPGRPVLQQRLPWLGGAGGVCGVQETQPPVCTVGDPLPVGVQACGVCVVL